MEPCQSRVSVDDEQLSLHCSEMNCNERRYQTECSPEFCEDTNDWRQSYETKPCEMSSDLMKGGNFDISDENIDSHNNSACFMVKDDITGNLNLEELGMESATSSDIKQSSDEEEEEQNSGFQDDFDYEFKLFLPKTENKTSKLAYEEPFQATRKILLESGRDLLMHRHCIAPLLAGANSTLATANFDDDVINWTFDDSADEYDSINTIEHRDDEKNANMYSDRFRRGSTLPLIKTVTSKTFEGENCDSCVKNQNNQDQKNVITTGTTYKGQNLAFGEYFKRAVEGCRVNEIDFVMDEIDEIAPIVANNVNSNKEFDGGEMLEYDETRTDDVVRGSDQTSIGRIDEDSVEMIDTAAEEEGVCYVADKCKIQKEGLNSVFDFPKSDINSDLRFCIEQNMIDPRIDHNNACIDGEATEYLKTLEAQSGIIHRQILPENQAVEHSKSKAGHLSKQFRDREIEGAIRSNAVEVRKVAFVKPTLQALSKPSSEIDFIELLLSTENMFEMKPRKKKGSKASHRASSGIDAAILPPKKSPDIKEDSPIKALSAGHVANMSWDHLDSRSMQNPCIDEFTSDLEAWDDLDLDPNFSE